MMVGERAYSGGHTSSSDATGIVIKCENMSMRSAVHYAHQVLSLCGKAAKYVKSLVDGPDVRD
jgi:hypothetical protein